MFLGSPGDWEKLEINSDTYLLGGEKPQSFFARLAAWREKHFLFWISGVYRLCSILRWSFFSGWLDGLSVSISVPSALVPT